MNTVKLLKVASSAFGISSNECMRIAEHLYLDGYITYPRTESTSYPAKFNFNEILENHKKNSEWGPYVSKILKQGIEKPNKGIDKGDHPPITPVKSANWGSMREIDWMIYEFITWNFLATISKMAKY